MPWVCLLLRRGRFSKAERHFKKAISTLTERNPNPYDGEPLYNLGLSLKHQGKSKEAYDAFFKATWNAAWQDASYFELAQLASANNDEQLALELVHKSMVRNWHHHRARTLKAALLRKTGQHHKAMTLIDESFALDRFNFGIKFEKYLGSNNFDELSQFKTMMRGNHHSYIEYALDYAAAGFFDEALLLLGECIDLAIEDAMVLYFCGWFALQKGDIGLSRDYFDRAENKNPDGCFAYRLEAIRALESAVAMNHSYAMPHYHLGNLWYDKKQYGKAVECWERARDLTPEFATVHRNLALAYYNKMNRPKEALSSLELAFQLNDKDARVLMELDQLYKKHNYPLNKRLSFLEKYLLLLDSRDDLYLERCTLYNQLGNPEKALDLLAQRKFHPWEGGEGKVSGQYLIALTSMAKNAIKEGQYKSALVLLEKTQYFPENLSEGKLDNILENDIDYWMALCYEGLDEKQKAYHFYKRACRGSFDLSAALFYNDQQPDKIFYQALALRKLEKFDQADQKFKELISFGRSHVKDKVRIDYFAVSLPDLLIWDEDLNLTNQIHCRHLMALGYLGMGDFDKADDELEMVKKLRNTHPAVALINDKLIREQIVSYK